MLATKYMSPLHETVMTTKTDYWNDSCSIQELTYALGHGAVGATTNPQIVLMVLKKEMSLWRERIQAMIQEHPTWPEEQITWKLIEEMAVKAAELLLPIYEREAGRKGRLSIQTNPALYRNAAAMADQAEHFNALAPNMQVKLPVTAAGVDAIEEATRRGVSINATVCFTVPQAVAVAEAVERGLSRRAAAGGSIERMSPVCTLMIGRMDDWIQVVAKRDGILVDPSVLHWPGVAVFKKTYAAFQERGYRARLLAAAYRHHLHWSELIGGDVVLTIPYEWQLLFNASDIEVRPRIQLPVAPEIVETLYARFADFRRGYDVDGMAREEFDAYGATVRTLRGFIAAYHELVGLIRDFMLPNPDGK
jgi:transaldolase